MLFVAVEVMNFQILDARRLEEWTGSGCLSYHTLMKLAAIGNNRILVPLHKYTMLAFKAADEILICFSHNGTALSLGYSLRS